MSTLIFDFDGTIADTFFIAVAVFRKLSRRAGSKRATDDEEVEILRGLPAREAIKRVGVHWWQLPYILYEARKAVRQQIGEVKAIDGVKPVIQKLHADGHKLYVVSSNSEKNIRRFLEHNGMEDCFDEIHGGIGLFAKSRTLGQILADSPESDCVYVGDEARDLDAATRAGMPCVSVAWGYNSKKALQNAGAKLIIEHPKELLAVIKKLGPQS